MLKLNIFQFRLREGFQQNKKSYEIFFTYSGPFYLFVVPDNIEKEVVALGNRGC